MTTIVPQTFPSDLIIPKLVEFFNSLPSDVRVIEPNDMTLFNVKIVQDTTGQVQFQIGDQSTAGGDYIGEATFMWAGERGVVATASSTSFIEVSKFLNVAASTTPDTTNPGTTTPSQPTVSYYINKYLMADSASIWNSMMADGVDGSKPLIVIGDRQSAGVTTDVTYNEPIDNVWLNVPATDGASAGQLMRLRPKWHDVQETYNFTIDAAKLPLDSTFELGFEFIGAMFDGTTNVYVTWNKNTFKAGDNTAYINMKINHEQSNGTRSIAIGGNLYENNVVAKTVVEDDTNYTSPAYGKLNCVITSAIPSGFYADFSVTVKFKRLFVGSDRQIF